MAKKNEKLNVETPPAPSPAPTRMTFRPDQRESALLLLRLLELREQDASKQFTRFKVSETTLRRIWGQHRLKPEFIEGVTDWLLTAGWALIFAGSTYALIRTAAVEGWGSLSSHRLSDELRTVFAGDYNFKELERLLVPPPAPEPPTEPRPRGRPRKVPKDD